MTSSHGTIFQQSVTLRLAAVAEGPVERDRLADGVTGALKITGAEADSVVDERTSTETAPITARIYDGIPAEDLAAAVK
ncbi:hypothetical protein [Streptomyces ferrugineus]|uniref:hypothetical protein n=1 Tax=Streptomyces ferrugineus TaxID=1413221 RepID=UPI00389A14ED